MGKDVIIACDFAGKAEALAFLVFLRCRVRPHSLTFAVLCADVRRFLQVSIDAKKHPALHVE